MKKAVSNTYSTVQSHLDTFLFSLIKTPKKTESWKTLERKKETSIETKAGKRKVVHLKLALNFPTHQNALERERSFFVVVGFHKHKKSNTENSLHLFLAPFPSLSPPYFYSL